MSHFSALVIGADPEGQLRPYHEFECTGVDDEFVQTIDITERARKEYAEDTETRLKLRDGTLVDPFGPDGNYKPEFLRKPTAKERAAIKAHSFLSPALPFTTTGYGDTALVVAYPKGSEEVQVPSVDCLPFAEWAAHYFGSGIVTDLADLDLAKEHKYGYVLVPPTADPVHQSTARVFDRTNPNKKWDWYVTGGRWTGFFKVKPGIPTHVGDPGLMTPAADPGWSDIVTKGDIDFVGMRAHAAAEAAERWDKVHAILDDYPAIEGWDSVRERYTAGITDKPSKAYGIAVSEARDFYHAQLGLVALHKAQIHVWDVEPLLVNRVEYIEQHVKAAITPFAIVMDGQWFERGSMGWWGHVSDEKNAAEWTSMVNDLIDGLSDDTPLTVVDCHI